MAMHQTKNADFESLVRESFARQELMSTLGARIVAVEPGEVVVLLPFDQRLSQQHGLVHAGAITSVADSACGYAALTLMPAGFEVLTVEFKVNFINPARGALFIARGQVLKSGRTVSVCQGQVYTEHGGSRTEIALMQATMIAVASKQPGMNPQLRPRFAGS